MTTLERIAYLRKHGIQAYRQIAENNCFVLAQAEWYEENDPSNLSTLWSLNYRSFIAVWLYGWDGIQERRKVPIFIDRFHVWQWQKAHMRGNKKVLEKITLGWL